MLSSKVWLRVAGIAAFASLLSACKAGPWGATPPLNTTPQSAIEIGSPVTPQTLESIVHAFKSGKDGAFPTNGSLVAGETGALYGTTELGGSAGQGTVFRLTPSKGGYAERVIYGFKGGNDGASPQDGVTIGAGALYATTTIGGVYCGCGTVFKLTPFRNGYIERVLYAFQAAGDGANPDSSLVVDKTGALYGTTSQGGYEDYGTIFKLTPYRSGYIESILHHFKGFPNDGNSPGSGLVADKAGVLYGTTVSGGRFCPPYGCGIVFELKPSKSGYAYRVIYSFKGWPHDADAPKGVLLVTKDGSLFGTSIFGGPAAQFGWGTVFKLKPSGTHYIESIVHSFGTRSDNGEGPVGGVIADAAGALYGATSGGRGSAIFGTVFKLKRSGSGYVASVLHTFEGGPADGASPSAGLILENGALYGTTYQGGENGYGTVFKVTP